MLIFGDDFFRSKAFRDCIESLPVNIAGISGNSQDVVSFIETYRVDIVLIDLGHAGIAIGIETAEKIYSMFELPVIFVCEKDAGANIPPELLCVPDGFLEKPFTGKEMSVVVQITLYSADLKKRAIEAEKNCRTYEQKYNLLSDHVQDVIATFDLDLQYTYISPSVKHSLGYKPEEFIGQPVSIVMTPESVEKMRTMFSAGELQKKTDRFGRVITRIAELEILKKDGSRVWSEARISLLLDDEGRHIGYTIISKDIDESKKINEQLRESEEKFRTLAEACPYGIMIYQDEYWVYTNPAGEVISGYSAEEFYTMKFWEIVHPDHQEMVRERGLKRQAGQDVVSSYDLKILDKNKDERWISLTGTTCLFKGKPAGMITIFDITQRKQSQQALWESEEKYRTIIENIAEGYYEVDLKGKFLFFNEPVCKIAALAPHEMWAVHFRDFTTKKDGQRLLKTFNEVYRTGLPAKAFDLEIERQDGQRRYVEISTSLMMDHSGQAAGFRGIIRDITDRKEAEEEKAVLEAQLFHAHKMEAVGTLAGGIAHDFNNILQAINGYTQLLLMSKSKDDPDCEKLMQLEKASDRAASLIQQLMTFSRKVEGKRQLISLNDEIVMVQKLLEQTLPKMIDIKIDPDPDLWAVNADPLHIEQILLNLGSNAADAMPDGGRLCIETKNIILDETYCREHVESVPGEYVMLRVSDTGCGMDSETVCHIFDPFYTTKAIGKGTGLGLASVYGIVKGHGGRINCYSEIDQGSVFTIYLPAVEKRCSLLENPKKVTASFWRGNETILVIDDEPAVREMAKEMLEYFGYQAFCVESGEVALDIYSENPDRFHLVILDINMPGMGGYGCMQKLLDIEPKAKILIASGYSTEQHAGKAISFGAASFIGKPYHLNEMARKVRTVLDTN